MCLGGRWCNPKSQCYGTINLWFFVDPVELGVLVVDNLIWSEPKINLLLCVLDTVGTVADVAADINGVVTTDRARSRDEGIGSTENGAAGFNDFAALPDHCDDRSAQHVGNESRKEGLIGEIGIMFLKVYSVRRNHLDCNELKAALFKARDDWAYEPTLNTIRFDGNECLLVRHLLQG